MSAEAMLALFPPDKSPYHWVEYPIESRSLAFLVANCFIQGIVFLIVGLRFYSRATTSSFGWDDGVVAIALVLCCATLIDAICCRFTARSAINLGLSTDFSSSGRSRLRLLR